MSTAPTAIDTVIVGAGFAGLYMLHRLRDQGVTSLSKLLGSNVDLADVEDRLAARFREVFGYDI